MKEKIEVTTEMIQAGLAVLQWWESDACEEWNREVLVRAMYTEMEKGRQ